MADRNRRFTIAAIALPFLLIAMAGLACANTIVVNTLDSGSQPFPLCTLEDAVVAANTQAIHGGCPAGTGNDDTIEFIVTGTIFPDNTLTIDNTSETLFIEGPFFGGITIDGQNTIELIDAEGTDLEAQNLTFTHGSSDFGGAIFAGGSFIGIEDCTFVDNGALGGGAFAADELAGHFSSTTPLLEIALNSAAVSLTRMPIGRRQQLHLLREPGGRRRRYSYGNFGRDRGQ